MFVPINEVVSHAKTHYLHSQYGENLNPYAFMCGKKHTFKFQILCSVKGEFEVQGVRARGIQK
jgi:hypothetical protein